MIVTGVSSGDAAQQFTNPLKVITVPATLEAGYTYKRLFIGRSEAVRNSSVGFELAGQVTAIFVDEGDIVSKGQALAHLDTRRLAATRAEAVATVQRASADLALSEVTLKRTRELLKSNGISEQALDEALENRNARAAALQQANAALQRIEVDIAKSTLYAPYDGIVTLRHGDEGQVVAAGAALLTLQDTATPEVRVGLPNHIVDRFSVGDAISVDTAKGLASARIKSVLPVRDLSTRTVDVILTFQNREGILPGDLVTWPVAVDVQTPGYWVPLSALIQSVRGLWGVYVAAPAENGLHRVTSRTVDVIYQDKSRVFVRGALREGELMIADGTHRVVPGQVVKVSPPVALEPRPPEL